MSVWTTVRAGEWQPLTSPYGSTCVVCGAVSRARHAAGWVWRRVLHPRPGHATERTEHAHAACVHVEPAPMPAPHPPSMAQRLAQMEARLVQLERQVEW